MDCHRCQVQLCISKTKNVFGILTSEENIDLLYTKPPFIYSLTNLFMVLEIKWGRGNISKLELGSDILRGC